MSRSSPDLLSSPYVLPWLTNPSTPDLQTTKTGYIEVDDGTNIWYGLSGLALSPAAGDKPPVVFLHGGFANSNYFAHQISALSSQFSIISIDSRGHGRSFDGPGPLTYDRMTLDVVKVLDHLAVPKAMIVGWSDGAVIGLSLALSFSDRVDRVFAFGATYNPSNVDWVAGKDSPLARDYFGRVAKEYKALSPTPDRFGEVAAKIQNMLETLPQWDATTFAHIPTRRDSAIAPLIFIVAGEKEEVVLHDVPFTLRDWISCSQLILLPGVGHFGFLQDPLTFNAMLSRVLTYY
ncbi:putative hydrolase or acyltransferase of alpha/beta superfamily [Hymenopellis radicata]|nr:putative hydrolase or acyltransferase of alpha/beta superfamily [Hymenopellis radicata]